MKPSWIILTFTGIIVLIMMVYLFRQNQKDRKVYEEELNKPSNLYKDESEVNDVQ